MVVHPDYHLIHLLCCGAPSRCSRLADPAGSRGWASACAVLAATRAYFALQLRDMVGRTVSRFEHLAGSLEARDGVLAEIDGGPLGAARD